MESLHNTASLKKFEFLHQFSKALRNLIMFCFEYWAPIPAGLCVTVQYNLFRVKISSRIAMFCLYTLPQVKPAQAKFKCWQLLAVLWSWFLETLLIWVIFNKYSNWLYEGATAINSNNYVFEQNEKIVVNLLRVSETSPILQLQKKQGYIDRYDIIQNPLTLAYCCLKPSSILFV